MRSVCFVVGNRDGRRYLMQEDAPGSFQVSLG